MSIGIGGPRQNGKTEKLIKEFLKTENSWLIGYKVQTLKDHVKRLNPAVDKAKLERIRPISLAMNAIPSGDPIFIDNLEICFKSILSMLLDQPINTNIKAFTVLTTNNVDDRTFTEKVKLAYDLNPDHFDSEYLWEPNETTN